MLPLESEKKTVRYVCVCVCVCVNIEAKWIWFRTDSWIKWVGTKSWHDLISHLVPNVVLEEKRVQVVILKFLAVLIVMTKHKYEWLRNTILNRPLKKGYTLNHTK